MTDSYIFHDLSVSVTWLSHICAKTVAASATRLCSCCRQLCATHRLQHDCCIFYYHWACCSALQCVAVRCSAWQCVAVRGSVLQCVVVCCNELQGVAVCCSVLQCGAVRCSSLQCVAVCCSVLQCVAGRVLICNIVCNTSKSSATQAQPARPTGTAPIPQYPRPRSGHRGADKNFCVFVYVYSLLDSLLDSRRKSRTCRCTIKKRPNALVEVLCGGFD